MIRFNDMTPDAKNSLADSLDLTVSVVKIGCEEKTLKCGKIFNHYTAIQICSKLKFRKVLISTSKSTYTVYMYSM